MARAPIWLAQLLTSSKSFEDNPLLASKWLNGWGLHVLRVSLAHRLATMRRARLAGRISAEDRTAFDRDGFVVCRDFLPPDAFQALLSQVQAHRSCAREKLEGDTLMRKIAVDAATHKAVPALVSLAKHPRFMGLVAYAGARNAAPVLYLQTLFRNVAQGVDPQCQLHADTFHPTVKAWLFLNDVAEGAGPFSYVPGSHRLTQERLAWERRQSLDAQSSPVKETREGSFRVTPEELTAMGLPPPRALAVPANTLIVADTFGFHARGNSVGKSQRAEVWAVGGRSPFLPWRALDREISAAFRGENEGGFEVREGLTAFDPAP